MTPRELKELYYRRNPSQEKDYCYIYRQSVRLSRRSTPESRRRAMAPIRQALLEEVKFQANSHYAHNQHISAEKTSEVFQKSLEIMELFEVHGFVIPRRFFRELLAGLGVHFENRWYCKGYRIMERLTADYGFFFCHQLTDYVLNCQWLDEEALRGAIECKTAARSGYKPTGTGEFAYL